ncbi:hypothetical protein BZA05DRAFT_53094 [Tricharina praecox]|uniref:uncharacterized protein n=1 Tax=Tricharina praecox TaxID=43433 RepID=UPI00221F9DE4|nr:uncharacterized protein BZA05DRAFT_53094 [Tricharina praecox]KAI5850923.1 hypothetical protein BZA05DRAFT_53094 [Tricharina praecox]
MDSTKSSTEQQQQPQTQTKTYPMVSPSTLASAASIESGGAKDSNTSTTTERALPLAHTRRSSHHYESDLAHHLRRASGEAPTAELKDLQKKFHQRRESYNREDQKHAQYAYIMGKDEKEKEQAQLVRRACVSVLGGAGVIFCLRFLLPMRSGHCSFLLMLMSLPLNGYDPVSQSVSQFSLVSE